jgi:hypothetical protein
MINDAFRTISIAHSYSVPSISTRYDDKYTEYFVKTTKFEEEKKKRSTKEASVASDVSDVADVDDEKEDVANGSANNSANSSAPHRRDRIVSRPLQVYQRDSDSDVDYDSDGTDAQTQDALIQVYNQLRQP